LRLNLAEESVGCADALQKTQWRAHFIPFKLLRMPVVSQKPLSSFTIVSALTTKPISYKNHKGREITVPDNTYVYVDTVTGIALIGRDHVDIGTDEYRRVDN
jgi:hypothetical protein